MDYILTLPLWSWGVCSCLGTFLTNIIGTSPVFSWSLACTPSLLAGRDRPLFVLLICWLFVSTVLSWKVYLQRVWLLDTCQNVHRYARLDRLEVCTPLVSCQFQLPVCTSAHIKDPDNPTSLEGSCLMYIWLHRWTDCAYMRWGLPYTWPSRILRVR